ncbi:uncharacterized protein B0T15DRAFT_524270 [Chaetomium strumarium]|uniref:Uncharacterized protein n=1 Tax=Chaetomium strumarium TaxID=1170767 RepID=A0AAJ0M4C9_9PEZI|nr:hypothetical protein B0T15DRAFT_524270 [Chaetomium strumarium]
MSWCGQGPYINGELSAGGMTLWATTGEYGTLRLNGTAYTGRVDAVHGWDCVSDPALPDHREWDGHHVPDRE